MHDANSNVMFLVSLYRRSISIHHYVLQAIYPTLFLEYLTSVAGNKQEMTFLHRFILISLLTVVLSLLNYRGLEIVGNASLIVCVIAMSPFVLMTVIGAPQVVVERWFQLPEENENGNSALFDDAFQTSPGPLPLLGVAGIMWRPYLNNLFWNLNSFDSAASFAGETTCVQTTYPRGIFVGLVLCIVCYIVPLMIAVGATDYSQSEWVDGHLGQVAVDIGGEWLGAWTVFAAGISNLAMFEAELSSDSFKLMGMAERGHLPNLFKKRSKYGTPTNGIILGTLVIIVFGCADFGQLLALLNANYAFSLLLEYAAFVKLRLYHKECKYIRVRDGAMTYEILHSCARFRQFSSIHSATAIPHTDSRLGIRHTRTATVSGNCRRISHQQLVRMDFHHWSHRDLSRSAEIRYGSERPRMVRLRK